ncbi:MAG TPA: hypothetical protein PLX17_00510 [Chitinophagaceae bacterium]|nr:hypothetical protein [Chitinophagaceae bacterium]
MATIKAALTIGEQIDRYKDGRTQKSIIAKLQEKGISITEVQFSNKKNGNCFEEAELTALSEILGINLVQNPA